MNKDRYMDIMDAMASDAVRQQEILRGKLRYWRALCVCLIVLLAVCIALIAIQKGG